MKFFVPAAQDEEQAERVYQATKRYIEEHAFTVRPTRYYELRYEHNGKDCHARVGEPHPLTREVVIAIFRAESERGPFMICTPSRGVVTGGPILATGDARATEFEE